MKLLKSIVLLFVFALLVGCGEDNPTDGGNASGLSSSISGPEGSSMTYTKMDGSTGKSSGSVVLGWDGGQLLNQNFYRMLRLSSSIGTFNIRFNMAKGSVFNELAIGENSFTPYLLLLEETQNLSELHIEGYFSSGDEFPENEPFSGTIILHKDKSFGAKKYSISGEIDAVHTNSNRKFKAYFWKEVASW